jgi:hypothetical protein
MFLLVNCSSDGDTYQIFQSVEEAKEVFEKECDNMFSERVVLLEPNDQCKRFGFGSQGDIFGAKVVCEFENEMAD